jgi:biopolymer transport protein ExbD
MIRIKLKPRDEDYSSFDITPLVDVVFLLLIFFLLTLATTQPSIDLSLPEASTAVVQEHQSPYAISIRENGTFFLNNEPATLEDIGKIPPLSEVLILEDKKGPYGIFITILDTLRKTGIEKISIVTDEKTD